MSWDIELRDPVEARLYTDVPHHEGGGTTVDGGYTETWLNVTYNYAEVTHLIGFSFGGLHERFAEDTIPELRAAVMKLGTNPMTDDYWIPTPGNVGIAIATLLAWAEQRPEGMWYIN